MATIFEKKMSFEIAGVERKNSYLGFQRTAPTSGAASKGGSDRRDVGGGVKNSPFYLYSLRHKSPTESFSVMRRSPTRQLSQILVLKIVMNQIRSCLLFIDKILNLIDTRI